VSGGRGCEGRGRSGVACGRGEAHGGIPEGEGPSSRAGQRRSAAATARPGREADRNHLPVDAQVPAGIGTAMELSLHPVAPASSGLSLSRSRWMGAGCQRLPGLSIASSG
jgi:hypothetical protein